MQTKAPMLRMEFVDVHPKVYNNYFVDRFFNFGGQVKKKPGSMTVTGGSGSVVVLARRRGSDRSLSGSAHELAVCAAQPPRAPDPPPHSHSQSNLCDIPFR